MSLQMSYFGCYKHDVILNMSLTQKINITLMTSKICLNDSSEMIFFKNYYTGFETICRKPFDIALLVKNTQKTFSNLQHNPVEGI